MELKHQTLHHAIHYYLVFSDLTNEWANIYRNIDESGWFPIAAATAYLFSCDCLLAYFYTHSRITVMSPRCYALNLLFNTSL